MSEAYEIVCEDTSKLAIPKWHEERMLGIGSSEAAASVGLSPWDGPYPLFGRKRGLLPTEDRPEVERFWWGHRLEPIILERWAEQYEHPMPRQHLMLRSKQYPWMLANPDGVIPGACVEAKTIDSWDESRWSIEIPIHYQLQGLHQSIVYGVRRCYFPVLFGGHRLVEFSIDYSDDEVKSLIDGEREFWRRVEENDPPDPDGSAACMEAVRAQLVAFERGETVELPADAEDWITTRTQYEVLAKSSQATADAAKQKLMLALGTAENGTIEGEIRVTFRADKNGKRSMRFPERKVPTDG